MIRLLLLTFLFGVPLALRPARQIHARAEEQLASCHADHRGIGTAAEMLAETTNGS